MMPDSLHRKRDGYQKERGSRLPEVSPIKKRNLTIIIFENAPAGTDFLVYVNKHGECIILREV